MPQIDNIKKNVQELVNCKTPEEKLQALSEAYNTYTEETIKLRRAYKALKEQFKSTAKELEESNSQLHDKAFELGLITEYMDILLLQLSQGIVFIDQNGVITTFNTAAERMLGIRSPVVLFDPFWDHFPDNLFGFSMKTALEQRLSPADELIYIEHKGGAKKDIQMSATFINETFGMGDKATGMKGLSILLQDMTEIRRLYSLTQRNDRMKELGELAASVAHEIRNPLGGIKGFASLLHRDLNERPDLQKMAQQIIDGADTMNRLVTQVLHYTRPLSPDLRPTAIIPFLNDLTEHVKVDMTTPKNISIAIKSQVEPKKMVWPIDPQLMRSCLLNLLVNSIQAMPQGGSITLDVSQVDNEGIIEVSDSGIGIKSDLLEKVFSPFFTTRANGTGFGLSEVYKIVHAHEGAVTVKSEENVGTTFRIKIPFKSDQ